MGRLIRPYNLIKYINDIDNLLNHKRFIVDILPGRFSVDGKIYSNEESSKSVKTVDGIRNDGKIYSNEESSTSEETEELMVK